MVAGCLAYNIVVSLKISQTDYGGREEKSYYCGFIIYMFYREELGLFECSQSSL